MSRRTFFLIAVAVSGSSQVYAQAPVASDLDWFTGCWEIRHGDLLIEEQWLEPRADVLLGVSRTTRGEEFLGFEFMRVYSRSDTLIYAAQPSGRPPTEFFAYTIEDREVVFENEGHDFPQRILYRAVGSDSLFARIEGVRNGELRGIDFPYTRVACSE